MNPLVVLLTYGGAVCLALFLLYWFGTQRWYWHLASVAAAVAIGLAPPIESFRGAVADLVTGFIFVLLFTWGVGATASHLMERHKHA